MICGSRRRWRRGSSAPQLVLTEARAFADLQCQSLQSEAAMILKEFSTLVEESVMRSERSVSLLVDMGIERCSFRRKEER